jgi:hypothetical protein
MSLVAAVAIVKDMMGARLASSYLLNASEDLAALPCGTLQLA